MPSDTRHLREHPLIFFNTLAKEVEPSAVVFIRRVMLLRRMLIKHPQLYEQISYTIHTYMLRGFPGTLGPGLSSDAISPAPPFGDPCRFWANW